MATGNEKSSKVSGIQSQAWSTPTHGRSECGSQDIASLTSVNCQLKKELRETKMRLAKFLENEEQQRNNMANLKKLDAIIEQKDAKIRSMNKQIDELKKTRKILKENAKADTVASEQKNVLFPLSKRRPIQILPGTKQYAELVNQTDKVSETRLASKDSIDSRPNKS